MLHKVENVVLKVGDEIYNAGDCCNPDHFGRVVELKRSAWGDSVKIEAINADWNGVEPYWLQVSGFSHTYNGNGSTRHVLRAAYDKWRADYIAAASRGQVASA